MPGFEEEPDVDELARPKAEILIGKHGLATDRTGSDVDLIVDHRELSLTQGSSIIAVQRNSLKPPGRRRLLLDQLQVLFWKSESQGDGAPMGNEHQDVRVIDWKDTE